MGIFLASWTLDATANSQRVEALPLDPAPAAFDVATPRDSGPPQAAASIRSMVPLRGSADLPVDEMTGRQGLVRMTAGGTQVPSATCAGTGADPEPDI